MEEAAVLHYTYSRFSDLTSRRDRCGCKPTKEDVKRCFMLEFDRSAFIIASTASEPEMLQWYHEHVVWNEETLRLRLLKYGILTRIDAPMVIIQGLRESGVFTSIIASAKAATANTLESSSSSSVRNFDSFKRTDSGKSSRKILNIGEVDQLEAVPPLSPPGVDAFRLGSSDLETSGL